MAGTYAGGVKTREKNLARDPDHYSKIGKLGGSHGKGPDYRKGGDKAAGFAANPELARIAGAKGGSASRRRPKEIVPEEVAEVRRSIFRTIFGR